MSAPILPFKLSSHQSAVAAFWAATDGISNVDAFDAAYDALSDAIESFEEFEAVCMFLGLA